MMGKRPIIIRAPTHSKLRLLIKAKGENRALDPRGKLGLGMAFLPCVSSSSLIASASAAIRADCRVGVASGLGAVKAADLREVRVCDVEAEAGLALGRPGLRPRDLDLE